MSKALSWTSSQQPDCQQGRMMGEERKQVKKKKKGQEKEEVN